MVHRAPAPVNVCSTPSSVMLCTSPIGWVASNRVVMPLPVAFCSIVPRSPRPTTTAREAKNLGCVVLTDARDVRVVEQERRVLDGVAPHDVDLAPLVHRDNRAVKIGEATAG